MRTFATLALISASICSAATTIVPRQSGSLPVVSVRGNAFFTSDNKRFYVRGVAYQPGGAADAKDPLLDIPSLKRDIKNFKDLGINTIRVYTVDNSQSHDEGMKLLEEAGIYLALDANTPDYSLNRETPATLHRSYNHVYLQNVFATIDAFAGYNNMLLFFSGNEVINARNNTNAATYIKAVTRDMKQYISNRHSRKIPVGYSAADVAENIYQQAQFFDCGTDDERADFFAFNDYSWCDPSSFTQSGWDQKVKLYGNYSVPIFLSEFGCIQNTREWNEVKSLYSSNMSAVYSGGLAYEYTVEPNGFGLVQVGSNGDIVPNADFGRLKKAYAATRDPSGDGGFKAQGTPSRCPPEDKEWDVKTTLLPAIPEKAAAFMQSGPGRAVGLAGDGSHFTGDTSPSTATPGSGQPTRTPDGQALPNNNNGNGATAGVPVPLRFMGVIAAGVLFGVMLVL